MEDKRYINDFLYFDEGPHKYTDTLGNEYLSVTTLIGNYYPKFDAKYWAHKKARELGISEAQVRKDWEGIKDEACERGTETHAGLENGIKGASKFKDAIQYLNQTESGRQITVADIPYMKAKPLDIEKFKEATDNKYPEIYRVFDFYINKGYTIYSEIGAYLIDYLVSGTIDVLCVRSDNFVILDWKTNREGLKFESGYYKKDKTETPNQLTDIWVPKDERMFPPLGQLPNCNGFHYTMQLSLYAYMTEYILGLPCVGLGLCHIGSPWIRNKYGQPLRTATGYHIDPNGTETVKWYRIAYLKSLAKALLDDRRKALVAGKKVIDNVEQDLFTI